ncbi:MAG: geranylgeranyl reductase family protein [Nitrospirales bacterium]|nr:geranylgeranyl reductase family protein [Nitrospirales bacterium]
MLRTHTLVIGAGPAGSSAARRLAERGKDTILIERDLSYVKPCGGGIPSTAFQELEIPLDTIRKELRKIFLVSPKGEELEIELSGGHICITERGAFDNRLRSLAVEKGARLMEAEFLRFEETGEVVTSVIREKGSGREMRIRSDFVVSADGISFAAGNRIKAMRPASLYTISLHADSSLFRDDACEFWFGSRHAANFYSWAFPSQGHCSVGTGSRDPRRLRGLMDAFLQRRIPGYSPAEQPYRMRAFSMPVWDGSLFNMKNILFCGDAAGMVMPVTYEGIYYAIKSGELAAQAIGEGRPGIYKKLWQGKFRNRFLLMDKLKSHLFRSDEGIEKWIALHRRPEVQEAAMRLWLRKETGSRGLLSYLKFFRHLLPF